MNLLQAIERLINWLLFTSLFAACCAVGLCMATERLLSGQVPEPGSALHLLVFGSTLIVYNIHYVIKKSDPLVSDRMRWSLNHRNWHFVMLLAGLLLCGISIWQLPISILLACAVLAVLSFAYSLPVLPFKEKKRLKDFGWIKITVLTGVWTIVTSLLPMLARHQSPADYPFEIILRFVFMLVLCIAFDIRDMQTDREAGIYTLPNRIGIRNSYRLMYAGLLLFAVLSVLQYSRYPSVERLVGALLTVAATLWAIDYTRKHPSDRAYLAYIDGMMLLYAVLVLIH